MSVCRKHRQQGHTSCTCFVARRPLSSGYGGPDVSDLSDAVFTALIVSDPYPSDSGSGSSSSSDSGSSSWSSNDSGSSSSSSSSYDSGSGSSSDSSW